MFDAWWPDTNVFIMKIVVVSESPCYPTTAGNRLRTLNLILPLAERHDITFLCRASAQPQENEQAREFLEDHRITPIIVDDPPARRRGWRFYAGLAGNMFSALPYSVAVHNSSRVREAIRDHAARNAVDLWQFEWLAYADALPPHDGTCKLVMAHDVMSLLWQRHLQTERNPLKRWYIRRQWRKVERYEGRVFRAASAIVAVSEQDTALARSLYGLGSVEVVDNGVDNSYFADVGHGVPRLSQPCGTTPEACARLTQPWHTNGQTPPSEDGRNSRQVLFLGSLESRPNLDAVGMLLHRIFPAVRVAVPDARLIIVGRNPPAHLRELASRIAGVELH